MVCVKLSFHPSFLDRTFAKNSKIWIFRHSPISLLPSGQRPGFSLFLSKKDFFIIWKVFLIYWYISLEQINFICTHLLRL